MNRCDYHGEEFQLEGLSNREMKGGSWGLRVWRSLKDGAPTESRVKAGWKVFDEQIVAW